MRAPYVRNSDSGNWVASSMSRHCRTAISDAEREKHERYRSGRAPAPASGRSRRQGCEATANGSADLETKRNFSQRTFAAKSSGMKLAWSAKTMPCAPLIPTTKVRRMMVGSRVSSNQNKGKEKER
jgi:hypothetical protein